jgi:putative Holliday junction resolvase
LILEISATGTVANPVGIILHKSRQLDARAILQIAEEQGAGLIVIGRAIDLDGSPGIQGRKAGRLAGALRTMTSIPVELWDESDSTREAYLARRSTGASSKKVQRPIDDLAAVVILQTYLDSRKE